MLENESTSQNVLYNIISGMCDGLMCVVFLIEKQAFLLSCYQKTVMLEPTAIAILILIISSNSYCYWLKFL